jgi:hypothetical protein
VSTADLIKRLREAAQEADRIDTRYDNPPMVDWEYLFIEAADALEEYRDDEPFNEHPSFSFDSLVEQADKDGR